MSDDRIERDVFIAAPLERVWALVAEPGFWVSGEASIWSPGETTALTGLVAEAGESIVAKNPNLGEVSVLVEKVEPPTYVAYRWSSAFPGEELRQENSTLVEFTLAADGSSTHLRVVESGFSTLDGSEDLRVRAVRFNAQGWPQVFDAIKNRAERTE